MRKLIIGLFFILAIAVAAALIVPFLIPQSVYREQVEAAAERALGRDVTLAGEVSISVLPRIQARAADVTIANPDGFADENFAQIAELRAGLALIPLISRRVEVSEFVLDRPVIGLESRANGANNWTFGAHDGTPAAAPASGEFRREPGALPISDLSLGDVRIIDGSITLRDRANGTEHRLENVNARISLAALDQPLEIAGDVILDGQPLTVDLRLDSLRGFTDGEAADVRISLQSEIAEVVADGAFLESAEIAFAGRLEATVPSLRALAAAVGAEMAPGETMESLSISGDATASPAAFAFENATIRFDDIEATGSLAARLGGERPRLTGALALAELNLNPYLPAESAGSSGGSGGVPPWSEDPIDLAPLRMVDADLRLTADALQFRDVTLTDAALHVVLDNGRLEATVERLTAFDGRGDLNVVMNARRATPNFVIAGELENIESLELLGSLADFDRLSGRGTTSFNLTASGGSQAAIMRSLAGTGAFNFRDGAIRGVDLGRIARGARDLLSGGVGGLSQAMGSRESTDFSELTATFNVANGVARTTDMRMLSPLLRVTGQGDLDVGGQAVDFTLRPNLVAAAEGQGGEAGLSGVEIPVRIRGPWSDVSTSVDARAAAGSIGSINIGRNAEGEAVTVGDEVGRLVDDNLGGDAGAAVRNLFGVPGGSSGETAAGSGAGAEGQPETPPEEEEADDPVDRALRDIFGGRDDDR